MEFPNVEQCRRLVPPYAAQLVRFGAEMTPSPLVLATPEYFPDPFTGDGSGAQRVLDRLQSHTGLTDIPIRISLLGDAPAGAHCGGTCAPALPSGALSRIVDGGDEWELQLDARTLSVPPLLGTLLARSLAHIFIEEVRAEGSEPERNPIGAEIVAVQLGLGALLLDGAHVYQKSCGGPSIQQFTAADAPTLALWTALFASHHGLDLRAARRAAQATQASLLGDARDFARAHQALGTALRDAPARVAQGDFSLEASTGGGWFKRWTQRSEPVPSSPLPKRSPPAPSRQDDLAELVADALSR